MELLAIRAAEKHPSLQPLKFILANQTKQKMLELQDSVYGLLEKTMGFLVGWSWYDVLTTLFGKDRSAGALTSTPHRDVGLACTATVFSISFIVATTSDSNKGTAAQSSADQRAAQEAKFLASALGMTNGWAWADAVATLIGIALAYLPPTVYGFGDRWLSFGLTFVVTILLITIYHNIKILDMLLSTVLDLAVRVAYKPISSESKGAQLGNESRATQMHASTLALEEAALARLSARYGRDAEAPPQQPQPQPPQPPIGHQPISISINRRASISRPLTNVSGIHQTGMHR